MVALRLSPLKIANSKQAYVFAEVVWLAAPRAWDALGWKQFH
jgi:hypothetical protein